MAGHESVRRGWRRLGNPEPRPECSRDGVDSPTSCDSSPPSGTFISSGAAFEGTLSLKGDFHIDAEYRGELETDGMITVGLEGSVVGDIRAREVVIRGAVVGNVTAPRQLVVEAHAKLHGDVETACLEIQKYAFFQGNTSMIRPQAGRRSAPSADAWPEPLSAPL